MIQVKVAEAAGAHQTNGEQAGIHGAADMTDHLHMLAVICGQTGGGAGLFLAMLSAGAVGSVVHCAPMCGPFVLAQVSSNLSRIGAARLCERHRVAQGLLLPYHFGRITTYAALGALAAGGGAAVGALPFARWAPAALLLAGALLFAAQATRRLVPQAAQGRIRSARRRMAWMSPQGSALLARLAQRIDRSTWRGGFLLGLLLGFLPCGMLYAALAAAAGSGSAPAGAAAMVAFGLGTAPGLAAVGIAGQAGGRMFARGAALLGPIIMLLNAALLTALAWQRLMPSA